MLLTISDIDNRTMNKDGITAEIGAKYRLSALRLSECYLASTIEGKKRWSKKQLIAALGSNAAPTDTLAVQIQRLQETLDLYLKRTTTDSNKRPRYETTVR